MKHFAATIFIALVVLFALSSADAQIGRRFPSEKKVVKDPVTGTMLTFLTSTPAGDSSAWASAFAKMPM